MKIKLFLLLFLCVSLLSCQHYCLKDSYHQQYSHLEERRKTIQEEKPIEKLDEYFLVILVDAKHLDYSDAEVLVQSIAKHPDGSVHRDVGHVWILLCGKKDNKRFALEGGHSGELGLSCPRYLDGMRALAQANEERNPVRYLFTSLNDGFFQSGSGGHKPTYAVYITLDKERFQQILGFMDPARYNYKNYSLTENQCANLAVRVAYLAGLQLDHLITIPVPSNVKIEGETLVLWRDPLYSSITVSSPDMLEKSLIQAVLDGKARPALNWYRNTYSQRK